MTTATFRSAFLTAILFAAVSVTTSCTVDQKAAYETGREGSKTKKTTVSTETETWKEKRAAAKEEREKARAEAERKKAEELAEKEAQKRKEEAEKKAIAEREAREEAEREREKEEAKAARKKAKEERKAARLAAKKKAEEARTAREVAEAARDDDSSGGGFSLFGRRNSSPKYRGSDHDIFVNRKLIGALNASNSKIEIDISEQKARVFRTTGGHDHLVIETDVSTGKSGHSTPTGSYRIKEKLVEKRSTRYGRWINSSGATVRADGDSYHRPAGATSFVGASMPYWMRVTGGIGMHIGYVPDYPASHGCIRVPSEIQPLIFSKVGVGTSVNIRH